MSIIVYKSIWVGTNLVNRVYWTGEEYTRDKKKAKKFKDKQDALINTKWNVSFTEEIL